MRVITMSGLARLMGLDMAGPYCYCISVGVGKYFGEGE